jgi:hypothetical protein
MVQHPEAGKKKHDKYTAQSPQHCRIASTLEEAEKETPKRKHPQTEKRWLQSEHTNGPRFDENTIQTGNPVTADWRLGLH